MVGVDVYLSVISVSVYVASPEMLQESPRRLKNLQIRSITLFNIWFFFFLFFLTRFYLPGFELGNQPAGNPPLYEYSFSSMLQTFNLAELVKKRNALPLLVGQAHQDGGESFI